VKVSLIGTLCALLTLFVFGFVIGYVILSDLLFAIFCGFVMSYPILSGMIVFYESLEKKVKK